MSQQYVIVLPNAVMGPYSDEDAAINHRELFGTGEVLPFMPPRDLDVNLQFAMATLQQPGDLDVSDFLVEMLNIGPEQAAALAAHAQEVIDEIATLGAPNPETASDEELARHCLRKESGNNIQAIIALRKMRYMGLQDAKRLINEAAEG